MGSYYFELFRPILRLTPQKKTHLSRLASPMLRGASTTQLSRNEKESKEGPTLESQPRRPHHGRQQLQQVQPRDRRSGSRFAGQRSCSPQCERTEGPRTRLLRLCPIRGVGRIDLIRR